MDTKVSYITVTVVEIPDIALKWRMSCHYALCALSLYLWNHGSRV